MKSNPSLKKGRAPGELWNWLLLLCVCLLIAALLVSSSSTSISLARARPTVKPVARTSTLQRFPLPPALPAPPSIQPGDWSDYLFSNSSFNGVEQQITPATARKLSLLWSKHTQGSVTAQPLVVDGVVYWGSWDGYERATTVDGRDLWKTYLGQTNDNDPDCDPSSAGVASTPIMAPVTLQGQTRLGLFVGGGDTSFYALDAATGRILWKNVLGSQPANFIWSSPVIYQGSVYIGVSSFGDCPEVPGKLVQMNEATGDIQNIFLTTPGGCPGGPIWGSPVVDTTTGNLFVATGNTSPCAQGEPYAEAILELRASDLTLLDSFQVPPSEQVLDGDFGSTPTLFSATINGSERQLVGAVNKNGIYYALDRTALSNGPVWEDSIASAPRCPDCEGPGTLAPAAWDSDRLYIAGAGTMIQGKSCQGSVRAVNPADGSYIWERCLNGARSLAPLALAPGVIIVGNGEDVYALSASSGSTLFKYSDGDHGSMFYGAPTIAHGMVYIGNMDGSFYAFGLPDADSKAV